MLVIRDAQLAAMKDSAVQDFENRLAKHLTVCYPERAAENQPEIVSSAATNSGRSRGLTSERDIASFACAMLLLGLDFIDDVRFPWAPQVLADKRAFKGDRLHECACIELGLDRSVSA